MENFNSPHTQQPVPPKSKKWLFILLGALIIGFIMLIVVSIIGTAVYFVWFTKPARPFERPFEKPMPTNSNSGRNTGSTNSNSQINSGSTSVSNDKLLKAIRSNSKVGRFTLQNVSATAKDKIYKRSLGEIKAIYTSGNDSVTFILSEYKSEGTAVSDFGQMFAKAKNEKAKIVVPLKFGKGTVGATFSIQDITMRAYCDWPANKEVLCNLISSSNADAITEFNNALKN